MKLSFILNEKEISIETAPDRRLLNLLREELGLTGTKEGCGTGECGACTILVNGVSRLACLMVAAQVEGARVLTVEGLSATPLGDKLQRAFVTAGAIQCGFCTPGMEMAAMALLLGKPAAGREEIRQAVAGNLCRCTGYTKIVDAVAQVVQDMGHQREEP